MSQAARRAEQQKEQGSGDQRARQHEGVAAAETVAGAIRDVADIRIEDGIEHQAGGNADAHQRRRQAHHRVIKEQNKKAGQHHQHGNGHVPDAIEQFGEQRQGPRVRRQRGAGKGRGCS